MATTYRYVTLSALLACLMAVVGAVLGGHVPLVFLQKMDSETIIAWIDTSVGSPAEVTRSAVKVVERAAVKLPEVRTILSLVGLQVSEDGVPAPPQSHLAQAFIELTHY